MIGADAFGPSFQRVLVRTCIADPGLRALVARFVGSGQLGFTDPASAWAWRWIAAVEYPSLLLIETEARRISATDPARAGVDAILTAADARDDDYVRAQVVEWARKQVFRSAFDEARAEWSAGSVDKAYTAMMARMEELQAIRLEVADRGWFFEELDLRQDRRRRIADGEDVFPIGIELIDRAMNGGLHIGELEVPIAYSGVGKTFWCVQRGWVAVRSRQRALHLVLEGGRGKTEDRYEARFAAEMYSSVRRGDIDAARMVALRREYDVLRENLVIRGFADKEAWRITYDDILAELAELRRSKGWIPGLIVVDYGDLVHAPGENKREQQTSGFRQLKALSERQETRGHRGYAVCAPAQAVRPPQGADEREHILKPRDIADCYEKVRVADALPTLNRTTKEAAEEYVRVHLGKYRDSEDGIIVRCRTDYKRGGFTRMDKDAFEEAVDPRKPPAPASA